MGEELKWYFETTRNTLSGANDPIHETFRAHPYYSIVRESIQNSMDVRFDETKPVLVKFEIITINQAEHQELFSIKQNIQSCLEFHKGNNQAEELYTGMLNYLDNNPSIRILKVSDYNTKGMHFDEQDHQCPFTSFMGEGISSKSTGAGGSFGFGKGAYYVPSELRTILVSTMIEDNKVFFQGRTRLASHEIEGEIKGKDGVFRIDENLPIREQSQIGVMFRREARGTDVYIIGMRNDPNCGEEMVKSVLNNFWLAVHEDRLDVVIKTDDVNVRLDETNLEDIMNQYFPQENEHGTISEIYQWNPRAYYKAVKYANLSENYIMFQDELPPLGPVRFYVYKKQGLQNRVCFMRKPAMTVYKTSRSLLSGYAASFVCDNEKGNEILRQMENAAHNEWKPENVRYVDHDKRGIYYSAKTNLNLYIREKLKEISGIGNADKMEISGLSEFLSIPEDLLDESESAPGIADSLKSGETNTSETEKETGSTTTTENSVKIKPSITKPSNVSDLGHTNWGEDDILTGGGSNDGEGGDVASRGDSDTHESGSGQGDNDFRRLLPVKFRVAAVKTDLGFLHHLIIHAPEDYDSVVLSLQGGTDNGEDTELQIKSTSNGTVTKTKVESVRLKKGKNIIELEFKDNLKHTLNLSAYET